MVSLILSLQVNTHILAKKLDLRILWWLLGGSNPVKGDFLVIAGATLYAVSNVTEVSKYVTTYWKEDCYYIAKVDTL